MYFACLWSHTKSVAETGTETTSPASQDSILTTESTFILKDFLERWNMFTVKLMSVCSIHLHFADYGLLRASANKGLTVNRIKLLSFFFLKEERLMHKAETVPVTPSTVSWVFMVLNKCKGIRNCMHWGSFYPHSDGNQSKKMKPVITSYSRKLWPKIWFQTITWLQIHPYECEKNCAQNSRTDSHQQSQTIQFYKAKEE